MFRRKHLEQTLDRLLNLEANKNVILVGGARQVGKSTLINSLLANRSNVIKLNLEEQRVVRARIDQTKTFEEFQKLLERDLGLNIKTPQILFIDEAQESEQLGFYVRFMKESWPKTKSILTGSSMTRLFTPEQRIPVGRIEYLTITPFDFWEFLAACNKDSLLEIIANFPGKNPISELVHRDLIAEIDNYLKIGGLPEAISAFLAHADYRQAQRSILYFQEEDFVRKVFLEKRFLFMEALRAISNNLGYASKYSHIADNLEDSKSIVGLLKSWHLIIEIEQHGISSTSRFLPKRYMYDLGIAQLVRNMPFPEISILQTLNPNLRTQLGGLMENMLLLSLMQSSHGSPLISSWSKGSSEKVEVDFIWREECVIPIECKSALKITPRSFTSLMHYLRQTDTKVGILVSNAPYQHFKRGEYLLINLPIYLAQPAIIRRVIHAVS